MGNIYRSLYILFLLILFFFSKIGLNHLFASDNNKLLDFTSSGSPEKDNQANSTTCGPKFVIEHQSIHCLDDIDKSNYRLPNVYSECGKITHLYNEDIYHEIGCQNRGFEGWYKTDNWKQFKIKGDGGVDVTGAPNALLVEGTSKASVNVMAGSAFSLEIIVPADGFINFDWSIIGGSNLSFTVRVGEKLIQNPDRFFSSRRIRAGESFSLLFQSTLTNQPAKVKLTNFTFFTKAISVVERKWTAIDEKGNEAKATQFISVQGLEPNQVIMPSDARNTLAAYYDKNIPSPEVAGYPVFDQDGDATTTFDQTSLRNSNCAVDISWKDSIEEVDNGRIILRKWVILQKCSGNKLSHTQRIRLYKHFDGIDDEQPAIKSSIYSRHGFLDNQRIKSSYEFMSYSLSSMD